MQKLKEFFRLALILLVIGLSVGYVWAAWNDPLGPPTGNNTDTPINVGSTDQTKDAGLGLNGNLSARNVFASGKLGVGSVAGPALTSSTIDPTAVLDVNGQIRIRGDGSPIVAGKVLKSVGDTGLALWGDVSGFLGFEEGPGIDLGSPSVIDSDKKNYSPSTLTSSGFISVWTGTDYSDSGYGPTNLDYRNPVGMIQKRITGVGTSIQAITAVATSGPATFSNFVTTVRADAGSGLTLLNLAGATTTTATSGPITLKIYTGTAADNSGLRIDNNGNILKVNVNELNGDGGGLDLFNGQVRFEACSLDSDGWTWQYNTVTNKWNCAAFPMVPSNLPGESVMYLRIKHTDPLVNPPACPTLPLPVPPSLGWTNGPPGSGLNYSSEEGMGASNVNRTRVCYRSDKGCQVVYLRSIAPGPTSCPVPPNVPVAWTEAANLSEWAPGSQTNYVRTCYICN